MEVLFVHPNFPGQFLRVAGALAQRPGYRIWGVGDRTWMAGRGQPPGVNLVGYEPPEGAAEQTHPHARGYDAAVRRGHRTAEVLLQCKARGLEPDAIFVHPGWGDGFFLRDLFPGAPVYGLFEYFYKARGADVGFDPEFPAQADDLLRVRALNATQLLALDSVDQGFCPTAWQRSLFPSVWRERLLQLHEGVDTDYVAPDPEAEVVLPDGLRLRAGDEVLTFASRDLEPYRGYHTFMRALPQILRSRPGCQVVIVGGDGSSYGPRPKNGGSWRQIYLDEVAGELDASRVHFTGPLAHRDYLRVLQVSRAHAYLTYPFILSWSMLEAMSAGCLVLGSATPPVEEVIEDGRNGLLFAFRQPAQLAELAIDALARPQAYTALREQARRTVVERYDFARVSLPAYERLLTS